MNHNLNDKESLRQSVAYYLNQSRAVFVVGGVAGTVVTILSLAFHFPGW